MTPIIGHDTEPGGRRIRCEEQPLREAGLELPVEEDQPAATFTLRSDSGEDVSLAELVGSPSSSTSIPRTTRDLAIRSKRLRASGPAKSCRIKPVRPAR